MNKKGIVIKNVLGLILAGFAIMILLTLFFQLLAPNYNPEEATVKAYLKSLEKAIDEADDGNVGEFVIWQGDYWLVYFGGDKYLDYPIGQGKNLDQVSLNWIKVFEYDINFFLQNNVVNSICICHLEDKFSEDYNHQDVYTENVICSNCFTLKDVEIKLSSGRRTRDIILEDNRYWSDGGVGFLYKIWIDDFIFENDKFAIGPKALVKITKLNDKYTFEI